MKSGSEYSHNYLLTKKRKISAVGEGENEKKRSRRMWTMKMCVIGEGTE
jgi:hypothetical protein